YARRPGPGRYLPVVAFFALGLAAKPMLVTLPFVLLLLDYWPLGRAGAAWRGGRAGALVAEKVPLLVLAGLSCGVTLRAQQPAIQSLEAVPLGARLANGLVAYVAYLGKAAWPVDLGVLYPLPPGGPPGWQVAGAALVLGVISAWAVRSARQLPWLL